MSDKPDEGGLRAPPELRGWRKWWWWFDFIILVKLARLRFIGILVLIGFVITQWDTLLNYYEKWTRPAHATAAGGGGDVEYFCPMHPTVIRDNAKEKCPICFMPLSKRKKGEAEAEVLPAGVVNRVQLSPYRVALAGVATWQVDYQPLTKQITAVGYVDFNERAEKTVAARVMGRIDQLLVNETGQMIQAGDVLASIYSPDLVVAVQNLVDAKQAGNRELLEATRTRLQLLGISDDQVEEVLTSGKAETHLKIRSPIRGHVIKKYVREGQYVQEGTPLYDLADLSTVWIQAQVYEDDLAFLPASRHDQGKPQGEPLAVTATTRAFPDEPFRGTLAFVYPHADQATRTVTVRFEMTNPDCKLRPGTTATVTLEVSPARLAAIFPQAAVPQHRDMLAQGRLLAVPEGAVIDTGSQKIVYRQATPGVYEGVLVQLGPRMRGPNGATFFPVWRGLDPGDRVVASGSFLVDAETRLNPAAGSIYFGGSSGGKGAGSSVTTARPTTPDDADAKVEAALAKLSDTDRQLAESQRFCPILEGSRLGSMGPPVKLMLDGQPVFLCCKGCRKKALADPQATLAKVQKLKETNAGAK
jgi:Cu(I)/Ag(I) efflux system membrane fusion protein